ncbi:2-amino-4-hydroxy-6-hydroxymethyldihydropteridine diphosphokinase [Shewanella sp. NFH-SH190041]|uniref:2-amino-4-hydroxy-6- hydroxymethyldihydropteridine diphosphokinase n=1 Tax=Shewanella sp. NFH-SH190041 TaxID=2950245 RepID=UPI0021C2B6B8|nr:2-amino-4-hydroxy-6-hydroxymethyldihydropteridine diphosphokinase [Shewanella sp. NFH-SH190041]BDM63581.1 2-amino-4-hydroxy-6-hydroxymethyldihydropteridine diphosphokinase [Shewanella sp. NFH-SH190041]
MATIYISLGSNIAPQHNLSAGLQDLTTCFGPLTLSSVYESEAVGFDGSNFLNMVAVAQTDMPVAAVVAELKRIELANGRTPASRKFAPRTLDLDLLLYDDMVCQLPVVLPRAEITENAFVLWPLAEVAPERKHPVVQQTYAQLWQHYNRAQKLWPVDMTLLEQY